MDSVATCPQCGKKNRIPALPAGKSAICGSCKATLEARDGRLLVLTDSTFDSALRRERAVVVDFWAAWCGPCRMIAPVIETLAHERHDVRFAKLDVDANPATSSRFRVSSIPMLVFFLEGVERGRIVGAVGRPQIEQAIREYLS